MLQTGFMHGLRLGSVSLLLHSAHGCSTAAELRQDIDWMEVTDGLQRRVMREFGVPQHLVSALAAPMQPQLRTQRRSLCARPSAAPVTGVALEGGPASQHASVACVLQPPPLARLTPADVAARTACRRSRLCATSGPPPTCCHS